MDVRRLTPARVSLLACCVCLGVFGGESSSPEPAPAPEGELTRAEALRLTAAHNPRLAAAGCSIEAAAGRTQQAGLRPNPEIEVEVEDLAGTRDASTFGDAVTTARIGQVVETGGKRAARTQVAEAETELERWSLREQQADLQRATTKAFTAVLAAQERLRLLEEAVDLAQRLVGTVAERVQAGKDAPLELSKAQVTAAGRRIERQRAASALQTARIGLASLWAGDAAALARATGDLTTVPDLPAVDDLLAAAAAIPELARWPSELARGRAALAAARAGRRPDVTVSAGSAWSAADGQATFLVAVSVPLPLFDRNQGAIREAYAALRQAELEQRAVEADLRAEVVARHHDLSTARQEALALAGELLPGAVQALDAARLAYGEGKTGYLEVLDAQQTLFEAQMQYLDALVACHDAAADLERLTGQNLIH